LSADVERLTCLRQARWYPVFNFEMQPYDASQYRTRGCRRKDQYSARTIGAVTDRFCTHEGAHPRTYHAKGHDPKRGLFTAAAYLYSTNVASGNGVALTGLAAENEHGVATEGDKSADDPAARGDIHTQSRTRIRSHLRDKARGKLNGEQE
jgi:hypothetical protein